MSGLEEVNNTNIPEKTNNNFVALPEDGIKLVAKLHFNLRFLQLFFVFGFVTLIGIIIWVKTSGDSKSSRDIAQVTGIQRGWTLHDKGVVAQKDTYRNFMLNIHLAKGVQYKVGKVRTYGMNPAELGVWIDINWDFSQVFYFDPYEVPILQIHESSLDPYILGPTGEIPGLAQMMPRTAKSIPITIKGWDKGRQGAFKKLCKKYDVSFSTIMGGNPEDYMLNFKYATFGQYVVLMNLRDELDNNRMWYILCYHWGFLRDYYRGGTGELPTYFEVQGNRYSVVGYWCKFMKVLETFQAGRLEAAGFVIEKWQDERKRMIAAERRFIKSVKAVKKVDKAYKKLETSAMTYKRDYEKMATVNAKALKELRALIPQIRNFNGKDIKIILNKYKGPIKDIVKANIKKDVPGFYRRWILFIGGTLLFLLVIITGIWWWSKKVTDKLSHSHLAEWYRKKYNR